VALPRPPLPWRFFLTVGWEGTWQENIAALEGRGFWVLVFNAKAGFAPGFGLLRSPRGVVGTGSARFHSWVIKRAQLRLHANDHQQRITGGLVSE